MSEPVVLELTLAEATGLLFSVQRYLEEYLPARGKVLEDGRALATLIASDTERAVAKLAYAVARRGELKRGAYCTCGERLVPPLYLCPECDAP